MKGDVIAGAKYMFPFKPRVVLSKHKAKKPTKDELMLMKVEKKRLRKEKQEAARIQAELEAAAAAAAAAPIRARLIRRLKSTHSARCIIPVALPASRRC